jgi:hypothetical protein
MKLTYRYSTGLAAISLVMSASADVIYSNLQDISIPADYDGVYLDVNAASAECRRWFKTGFFVGAKLDRFQREMAENRGPC